ncbi:hypothetical protein [Afipia sp. Root123D2]|uniref:hypothetical protein n=1 Tax=Afipia sp. Root123D2 TaxID=1736436 RepID=UPI0012E803B5|nr:hypothetical protein [Afipia sp. Root123D2]
MISDEEIANAKALIRKIEDESPLSKAKKDEAWKAAGGRARQLANLTELARTFGASTYSDDINLGCRASLAALRNAAKLEPTTPKRDF